MSDFKLSFEEAKEQLNNNKMVVGDKFFDGFYIYRDLFGFLFFGCVSDSEYKKAIIETPHLVNQKFKVI